VVGFHPGIAAELRLGTVLSLVKEDVMATAVAIEAREDIVTGVDVRPGVTVKGTSVDGSLS